MYATVPIVEAVRATARPGPVFVDIHVRPATLADLDAIVRIYAEQLLSGLGSWEEVVPDHAVMAERMDAVRSANLPWLVATDSDGQVLGYCHARPFRSISAYRGTVEDCIHVAADARGQGVGRRLLAALIETCAASGYRQMIAVIGDAGNQASIALHEASGFQKRGVLPGAGERMGQPVDVVLMQRALPCLAASGRA